MNNLGIEIERLRHLPKLVLVTRGRLTVEKPLPGSRRLRCMVDGLEYDPTGLFDKNGRTNFDRLSITGKSRPESGLGNKKIEYIDFVEAP